MNGETCVECGIEFMPSDNAEVVSPDGPSVQVVTHCAECGAGYMTFIEPNAWTRDRDGDKEV